MLKLTFTKACMQFFGKHPGQTLQDFAAELKALGPADRTYFIREFRTVGIEVTDQ